MTSFLHGPLILMAIGTVWTGLFHHHQQQQEQVKIISTEPLLGRTRHHKDTTTKASTKKSESKTNDSDDTFENNNDDLDFLSSYTQEARNDYIRDLPGLNYDPGFLQFSGYLEVDEHHGRRLFYWYVESQGDPATDPVVWWSNGGPGCSGLIAFGTEHGPYFIDSYGTLRPNPFSWNKVANMLYVEQPAGVGFSYSDSEKDYHTGDARAAKDNYRLIIAFLKRFPERQSNPFYISSESYGGHYMPQLTLEILKRDIDKQINFQGMIVGNPFVDPFSNTVTQIQAFYSHGLLAKPLYDQWSKHCTRPDNYDTKECEKMEIEMFKELYGKINPYALDYPICLEKKEKQQHEHGGSRRLDSDTSSQVQQLMNYSTAGGPPFLPTQDIYRPCSEEHMNAYLNRADVQKAIHVHTHAVKKWRECSDIVHYSSADFSASIIDLYKVVIEKAIKHGLQIFVFSGDDDSVCSTAGTQYWIYDLGYAPKANLLWKNWKVEKEVAGYATIFELGKTDAKFTFATVHGAGHEVPAYRPMEALEMFRKVLNKEW